MAYHHLLVLKEGSSSQETLIFKDLSEQELRASFVTPLLNGASIPRGPDDLHRHTIRARIIRTERQHDAEVDDYLREWWRKAEEFMLLSGQPISSDQGDSAIAGPGKDVTAEFLLATDSPASGD